MNVMFIFAHPDDEAYGPAGTIHKLAQKDNNVTVVSMCRGNRPGMEEVCTERQAAFKKSCERLGAKPIMFDYSDCRLEYDETLKRVEELIAEHKPDLVYTHSNADIHKDHRLVSEVVQVACRPKPDSTVNALYMCELPSSTDWGFDQFNNGFRPNVFKDVSDHIWIKQEVMGYYSTETYHYPDARSIESMETLAMHRGKTIGCHRAEAFQLVFSHDRGIQ